MKLLFASLVAMLVVAANAAPGTNATCLQSCPPGGPYTPNCCNCCPGGTCSGNGAEFTTCCTKDQDFCGCISSRAFCSGRTANGANLESPFGTCYTKGTGVCSYEPSPNVWILCPVGTTGCISSNTVSSCCTSSQTCNTITGLCESSGPATCNGQAYNPALYTCAINAQGQQVLCPTAAPSACGTACYNPSQYCCQAGALRPAGQCSGGTSATTQTTQTTATTTTTTQPPSSTSGPATCNGQVYDPSAYTCASNGQGQFVLCPKGNSACGAACFNPAQYCCQAGALRQAGQCSGGTSATTQTTQTTQTTATTTATTQPPSSTSGPATCNGQVYDPAAYTCASNGQGQFVLCPKGYSACGSACFNPAQYCCQAGALRQAGQCSGGTSATTQTTTQTTATTSATTQPPSSTTGPATCNGQAYDPSAYTCASNGQGQFVLCPKGYSACGSACFNPAQYCCQSGQLRQPGQCSGGTSATTQTTQTTQTTATTTTTQPPSSTSGPSTCNGQVYDPAAYTCASNGQGQFVLCPKGNSACGAACFNPAQYCCQAGALRPAGQCSSGTQTCSSGETYNPATSYCCASVSDSTHKVCPTGQHCCGNILNGTNYYGPGSLYTACYNPATSKCCYGGTSSFLNPATIEPISYVIPSGAVRICVS